MSQFERQPGDPGETRSTLLDAVRRQDEVAWARFVDLYAPLVYTWCRRDRCSPDDADDVVQEVFGAVHAAIDRLRRDKPADSFRAWLRVITRNKVIDHHRRRARRPLATGGTDANEQFHNAPAFSAEESADDIARDNSVLLGRALEIVKDDFSQSTWQAFWRCTVEGQTAAVVAELLGMKTNAVRQARHRVMRRLRDEFGPLLD